MGKDFKIPATARWRWNPASDDHSAAPEHSSSVAASDLEEDIAPGPVEREISPDLFGSPSAASAVSSWLADFMSEGVWFGCPTGCCEDEGLDVLAANFEVPAFLFWGGSRAFAHRTVSSQNGLYGLLPVQPTIFTNAMKPLASVCDFSLGWNAHVHVLVFAHVHGR